MFGFGFGGMNPYNHYARLASFGPAPYTGQSPYGMGGFGGMGGISGFLPFGGMGGGGGFNPYAQISMPYQPSPYQGPEMGQLRPSAAATPPGVTGGAMTPGGSMGGAQPGQGAGAQMYQPGGAAGFWDQNRMNQAGAPSMGAVRPFGGYQGPNMGYVR